MTRMDSMGLMTNMNIAGGMSICDKRAAATGKENETSDGEGAERPQRTQRTQGTQETHVSVHPGQSRSTRIHVNPARNAGHSSTRDSACSVNVELPRRSLLRAVCTEAALASLGAAGLSLPHLALAFDGKPADAKAEAEANAERGRAAEGSRSRFGKDSEEALQSRTASSGSGDTADVLVIGGGAAGLSAAIAAAELGASVLLIEKMSALGGDTLISGGYYNAVDPVRQSKLHIVDSIELFESQMLDLGDGLNSPEVVRTMVEEAGDTLSWLEKHGLVFLPQVFEVYGSMHPRAHKPVLPRGTGWIRALSQAALTLGVKVRTNVRATRLLVDEETGAVSGAAAMERKKGRDVLRVFHARKGVVIAAGGYGANKALVAEASPAFENLPVDSLPGATGDLIEAAREIGGSVVNMQFVECVPGSRAGIAFPIRLDYIPRRMIMVDRYGRRFTNEGATRTQIAADILKAPSPAWCIADADTVASFDAHDQKNLYRGLYMGEAFREKSPKALAERLGANPKELMKTLKSGIGRERLRTVPLWVTRLHLRIHTTLGGIAINPKAQALRPDGSVIPHLYAAGASVGNIHGRARIGANGLTAAAVFGRIAGADAALNDPLRVF